MSRLTKKEKDEIKNELERALIIEEKLDRRNSMVIAILILVAIISAAILAVNIII